MRTRRLRSATITLLTLQALGCNVALGDPLAGEHSESDALRIRRGGDVDGERVRDDVRTLDRGELEALDGQPTGEGRDTMWAVFDCPAELRVSTHPADGGAAWASTAEVLYEVNDLAAIHDEAGATARLLCAHRREDGVVTAEVARTIEHTTGCTEIPDERAFACRVFQVQVCGRRTDTGAYPGDGFAGHQGWDDEGRPFSFFGTFGRDESGFDEEYCRYRMHVVVQHHADYPQDVEEADRLEEEVTTRFEGRGVRVLTVLYSSQSVEDAAAWRAEHGQSTTVVFHGSAVWVPMMTDFIVDSTGTIRWRGRLDGLPSALEELLRQ